MGRPGAREAERVEVSDALVASLVREQCADLGPLEVGRRYVFDDHITIRLGDAWCANFPTDPGLDPFIERAGPLIRGLAPRWSFPAGTPIFTGQPAERYPYHWEVARWLPGSNATIVDLEADAGLRLGHALREIHSAAPSDAPDAPSGASTLASLGDRWAATLAALAEVHGPNGETVDRDAITPVWDAGVEADPHLGPTWIHGNLDPRYVVSDGGRFGGICSWFTFGKGDPAVDLGAACLTLPTDGEDILLAGYGGIDAATRHRVRAYRLLVCATYASSPNPFLWRLGWDRLRGIEEETRGNRARLG